MKTPPGAEDMQVKKNVDVFNQDVLDGQGYKYTTDDRLSTRLANERMTRGIREATNWNGRSVLDVGCGDGTFSHTLVEMGADEVVGMDPASAAIERAQRSAAGVSKLRFEVRNVYELDGLQRSFDIVVFRGVLHHLPDAARAVRMAAAVAREIVILEPNGTNPVLKAIEKLSPYHRQHEEQSFLPGRIRRWCAEAGFVTTYCRFINIVPIFFPGGFASLLKRVEPLAEAVPVLRNVACGQVVVRAERQVG